MKKILFIVFAAFLLTLTGCEKKNTLSDNLFDTSNSQRGESDGLFETSNYLGSETESYGQNQAEIKYQKISELRKDLETQLNTVKKREYDNLHITEDFVVRIPDVDVLYNLTLTTTAPNFKTFYEKFDKTFDKEFVGIYSKEEKDKLYYIYDDRGEKRLLINCFDELMSGEIGFSEIYVETEKAYLAMFSFGNGIYGLNHDGIIKLAKPNETPMSVALTFASKYFKAVKNYLDVDSDDKYTLIDRELSIREAVENVKKIVSENGYSWGGSLEPDVFQVKVFDVGDGIYGLSFTMAPSYKGVLIDVFESPNDASMITYEQKKLAHEYRFFSPNAFMLESDKLDSFSGGDGEYFATELKDFDSVISFDQAVRIVSEAFGTGMDMSLSRAELHYSAMYPINDDYNYMAAFPVWKFRCHNSVDNLKYIVYVNAINENVEYYTTNWWEI